MTVTVTSAIAGPSRLIGEIATVVEAGGGRGRRGLRRCADEGQAHDGERGRAAQES